MYNTMRSPIVAMEGQPVKAAPFEYHAPETLDEALALLAEFGDEAKVLAGGRAWCPCSPSGWPDSGISST